MPDVIVPPPPLPPVLPPDPPERDDPAEPDGQEDEPSPVLNRAAAIPAGAYAELDGLRLSVRRPSAEAACC